MGDTEDRRVLRTKKRIRDTFAELIEEKGLDRVTVKDLTEQADINRGTFYLHFHDKYDLLEQSEAEILNGIKQIAKELDDVDMNNWKKENGPHPAAEKYFTYLKEHALFVRAVLGPKGDPGFQRKMKTLIADGIKKKFAGKERKSQPFPADYLIAYLVSAHLGVVQHWIENGLQESPEEMAKIISSMNYDGPLVASGLKKDSS
ncbi:TetR/AcrR family transcriptional regulator [Texcoconibacillus texcoconensis]|uniref:AcrR family transcriptional regulator n=1 Tax=Texcoconibacillus texcoconensis TaxID=1095777 RepID=A0A840QLZ0_9BACI|nr:TetR/AcrR family transcriptional regulator [Texcoconibacillus texcoconensis]MBB5172388.1 AcrR family transcriptional regulator [Texcoconibacillus texcoconensis]